MKKEKQTLTLRQIAKLAKTSKSTVSRVLTKHPSVSPKTRERVQAVIHKHGFRPNLFARGLAGGKTGLIAVLTSEMNSGFFAEVLKGIDAVADQHDGHVLSSFAHGIDDYIELWRNLATNGRVDGVILIAPPLDILERTIGPDEVPVVLCACTPDNEREGWRQVDSVTLDNQAGMNEMLRHLVEQGCRNFTHLAGPYNIYDAVNRRTAFETFIDDHPHLQGRVVEVPMTREAGRAATLGVLKADGKPPDAFVAVNDLVALGVLEALKESALSTPGDVAVAGCDDDPASGILGLTTLHMPMVNLGRETARLLFDRLDSRENTAPARESKMEMTLRVRSTTLVDRTGRAETGSQA